MYNACADNSWPQQIVLNKHATVHACITIPFGRSSCLTAQIKVLSQSFFSFCYRAAILTADGGLDAAEAAGLGSGALGWGGDTFAGAGTAAGLGSAHLGWGGDTFAGRGTAAGLGSGALGWGGDTFAVAGVAVALGSGGAAAAGGFGLK